VTFSAIVSGAFRNLDVLVRAGKTLHKATRIER
jgi:hypothetical protein